MIDIKKFEREVIDEVKPNLIIRYLMINDLNIIPREVSWLIIEKLYYVMDDVVIMYQDINRIYWCQLFLIKLQSTIIQEDVDLSGISPVVIADLECCINQTFKTILDKDKPNEPDMTIPIHMSGPLSLFIEKKLTSIFNKPMMAGMMKRMIVGVLKSNEKYLTWLNLPPKANTMMDIIANMNKY